MDQLAGEALHAEALCVQGRLDEANDELTHASVSFEQMDSLGINPYVSGIGVAIPAALLSFVLLKMLVFRKPGSR